MMRISDGGLFLSSACMLWLDRAFAGAGLLRELVWGLTCPVHCGSSGLPLLILGFFIGLLSGFGLALGTLWILYSTSHASTISSSSLL